MDESLAFVAVDLSGRPVYGSTGRMAHPNDRQALPTSPHRPFHGIVSPVRPAPTYMCTYYMGGTITHQAEAIFKALGRALGEGPHVTITRRPHRAGYLD